MDFRSEVLSGTLSISFSQPGKMNPLSIDGFKALALCIRSASENPDVDAIILTGEGEAFCAGLNLASFLKTVDRNPDGSISKSALEDVFDEGATAVVMALQESAKPTIAAINGVAAGAGAGIALSCDVVVAAENATINLPFVPALGVCPDCGLTWVLPRLLGRGRALPIMLLGEPISAKMAENCGLIWKTVAPEKLHAEAMGLAKRLADGPTAVYRDIRRAVDSASSNTVEAQLNVEKTLNVRFLRSAEFEEGVQAFIDKRRPNFNMVRPLDSAEN